MTVEEKLDLYHRLFKRMEARALLMSTVKKHTYMKAVGTNELGWILKKELELSDEDLKHDE